jgi:glutathione S-transferase
MIAAHELGVAKELTLVRAVVHPARPNSEVMAFNPLSKIPTLVVGDDLVLYDSRVICDYLEASHGRGRLVPPDGPERWRVLTWQALADGMMETALLWLSERARPDGARQDDIVAGCALKITTTLDRFECDEGFLSAGKPTLGHIAVGSALLYLDFRFAGERWRDSRPRLQAWFDTFSTRSSVAATAFQDVY